jgi:hypothetical protein
VSDARWFEVDADIGSAVEHFRHSLALHAKGGFEAPGLEGYQASMALMHALQSAHTSLEGGLLRILEMLGEERPVGEDWHYALIRRVAADLPGRRPAILTAPLAEAADETRRFRHRAAHNYDSFRLSEIGPTIAAAERLSKRLEAEIRAFKDVIDPSVTGGERA